MLRSTARWAGESGLAVKGRVETLIYTDGQNEETSPRDLLRGCFFLTCWFPPDSQQAETKRKVVESASQQSIRCKKEIRSGACTMRSWLMADGDDGDQWDEFYSDGVVRITGRQKLGDLQRYASVPELAQALRETYRELFETKSPAITPRLCFNFGHEVMVGDDIFVRHRRKTLLGYGTAEPPPGRPSNAPSRVAYFFDEHHPNFPHAISGPLAKKGTFPGRKLSFSQ